MADRLGMVKCVTCPATLPAEHMQAGHFIPGRKNAVLYSEMGVNPQCYRCNMILKGNWPEYLKYMTHRYGQTVVNQLLQKSRQVVQMKTHDHLAVFEKYRALNKARHKKEIV